MNTRAIAARILVQVCFQGRSLSQSLADKTEKQINIDPRDNSLIQELCYGVLRNYQHLSIVVEGLLNKPLKAKDNDVQCLLLVGLYQLIFMRVPDHAAVSETVLATNDLKKSWAKNLINAVLRNFLREKDQRIKQAEQTEEGCWSHPQWLINEIRKNWPDQWEQILTANNQRPPMTLRVNQSRNSTDDYMEKLARSGVQARVSKVTSGAIQLSEPVDVHRLPGFNEGLVSVQDTAAQLAAEYLQLENGQTVLDVCAAPGGKTGHILESTNVELVAIDVDKARLEKVDQNLKRLGGKARLKVGDARDPDAWWDGQVFDRILLDAPCSATGVIRRHPDIKVLRRESDITNSVKLQAQILKAMWPLLKPEGMLLYATCSVLRRENSQQIAVFLKSHPDAIPVTMSTARDHTSDIGRQIMPGENGMDGFYYACLKKQS